MITRDEFGFALREVEGQAVRLGKHGDGEDAKADDDGDEQHPALEAEALAPEGQQEPAVCVLIGGHLAEVQIAEDHEDGDDREAEGDLIRDHLGAGAHPAEEGVFRVRRPAGEDNAIHTDGGDGEGEERPDAQISDDELHRLSEAAAAENRGHDGIEEAQVDLAAEGQNRAGEQGGHHDEAGSHPVIGFPDVSGHEVLLQDELQPVRRRLGETADAEGLPVLLETKQRERHADAIRTHTVLDHRGEATLEIHRDRDERQNDQKAEENDLPDRDGEGEQVNGSKGQRGGHLGPIIRSREGGATRFCEKFHKVAFAACFRRLNRASAPPKAATSNTPR